MNMESDSHGAGASESQPSGRCLQGERTSFLSWTFQGDGGSREGSNEGHQACGQQSCGAVVVMHTACGFRTCGGKRGDSLPTMAQQDSVSD